MPDYLSGGLAPGANMNRSSYSDMLENGQCADTNRTKRVGRRQELGF